LIKFLYISDIEDNKYIFGKVLTNKSIEKCGYSYNFDLCIPKDYKLKCLINRYNDEDDEIFKTCEEEEKVIEESTDGKCGEGHGKCPFGQCCNKEGKCGNNEDYCLVTKGCQMNYGACTDECEIIYRQLISSGENIKYVICTPNEQGKAKFL